MSDFLKHECGIALLRLLKPSEYYTQKYGDAFFGLNTSRKLMEAQSHRGQDGAGLVSLHLSSKSELREMKHFRSASGNALKIIFNNLNYSLQNKTKNRDIHFEIYLGHLRYGTYGNAGHTFCHPFVKKKSIFSDTLAIAGNFNLTNLEEVYKLHQNKKTPPASDTEAILEIISDCFEKHTDSNKKTDIFSALTEACKDWDGGFVISGLSGNGDTFVIRDSNGIRPAHYFENEEFFVMASERQAIHEVMNVPYEKIIELEAGCVITTHLSKKSQLGRIIAEKEKKSCAFERIYFSSGEDPDIKAERMELGSRLLPGVKEIITHSTYQNIFTFIPNTAEKAFLGFMESHGKDAGLSKNNFQIIKIIKKKADFRLFISEETNRNKLLSGAFKKAKTETLKDRANLVLIDDSIVRGNTLKLAILKQFSEMNFENIIIASSAPQVRYPDCYGIDMSRVDELIVFRAAIELLKEKGLQGIIDETYQNCLRSKQNKDFQNINHVKNIYAALSEDEINTKVAQLLKPENMKSNLYIVYQKLSTLNEVCQNHKGNWYFSGDYPGWGGYKVVNESFINYIEGNIKRAY